MLAAIDIGTNSVHMVVARASGDGRFEVVTRHKEMVRLGSGGDELKELSADAVDRGIAALRRCRSIVEPFQAMTAAVATSAIREARNAEVFIERARVEAGIDVEVISGYEEARLIHLGILQALPLYEVPLLMCDIGGGSTELAIGHRGELSIARSFKLGAIRLSRRCFADGRSTHDQVVDARAYVAELLLPFVRESHDHPFERMVGSSGTIETLLAMANAAAGVAPPRSLNAAMLGRDALGGVIDALIAAGTVEDRRRLPGLDAARADIILAGAFILEGVMDGLGAEEVQFSDYALREGVIYDLWSRWRGRSRQHLSDLRRRSVEHLMELCDEDPEHSLHVASLALALFDGLESTLGLGHFEREVLEAAALLANVGIFVSHSRHHQHSYYVIRNSEHLIGFTDHEIELVAQVARYHRKSEPTDKHAPFAALSDEDRARVLSLAAILRIAIGLDRSYSSAVDALQVAVDDDRIVLTATPSPGADVTMELYAADDRKTLLESVAARRVEIVTRS